MAAGTAVAVYVALRVVQRLVASQISRLAAQTANEVDDFLADLVRRRTKALFLLVAALFAGTLAVSLPDRAEQVAQGAFLTALWLQAAVWGNAAIAWWLPRLYRQQGELDTEAASAYSALSLISRVGLWVLVLLLVLESMGVKITALVAGLGLAGVAVALALQNILGDLFASLSIVLDKPFVVGDFIVVGDFLGTVEHVGIKTTRVRSLSGEQIVFSNADLLQSRIRNYKRMQERRVVFELGVTYETPYEKLAAIPDMVRAIISEQPHARFDRAHFARYGDFSLVFEVVYYVTSPDYNLYMDTQQAINLAIFRRFQEEGIEFAYPTQKLYLSPTSTTSA